MHGRFSVGSSTAGAALLPAPLPRSPCAGRFAYRPCDIPTENLPAGARPESQTKAAVARALPVPSGSREPLSFGSLVACFPGQMAASRSRVGDRVRLRGRENTARPAFRRKSAPAKRPKRHRWQRTFQRPHLRSKGAARPHRDFSLTPSWTVRKSPSFLARTN